MAYTASKIYPVEQNAKSKPKALPSQLPRTSEYLFNRELSLIAFFQRVLEEALDETQPLLERLKFLAILSSNLDEFFMIRVSGLKEKLNYSNAVSSDGMTVAEQLSRIREAINGMLEMQTETLRGQILPLLAEADVALVTLDDLTETERQHLDEDFKHKIYPLLTPQAVDPTHPFPYISGGSLNIGLSVRPKVGPRVARVLLKSNDTIFVRIKIPPFISRFVPVDENKNRFVLIEDLITANVKALVPEADADDCHLFRITRDADIGLREEEAEDLLETMEQNLRQRRFGDVVRLEISASMPAEMIAYLRNSLQIDDEDIYAIDGPLNVAQFMELYKSNRPSLKDEPLKTYYPSVFDGKESTFEIIKRQDVLLHHPYNPYEIVTNFLKEAVEDPQVLAIKMCLYRTGADSPIPPLLIEASERGKLVTVLVELKARFDEENNIEWAKKLERAGVHVVYGLLGLKTHCKTTLVVRREGDELRRYVHLATGNYNPETSAFYTDLGLLTDDDQIGEDATELFNFLTAYSEKNEFRKLLVAPINLRQQMVDLIKRETANAKKGLPARIVAKMNRLADVEIIRALYEASQAGVKIDLIVRGICMLRPQVKGLSENITVRSIVGRLLEHSRVYHFANGGADEAYIGSSDWMPRNLDRRVEALAPVEDESIKRFLIDDFLTAYLRDNVKARILQADGSYVKAPAGEDGQIFNAQLSFQGHSNVYKFDHN